MWMASRLNWASPNSNKGGCLYHCHSLLALPYLLMSRWSLLRRLACVTHCPSSNLHVLETLLPPPSPCPLQFTLFIFPTVDKGVITLELKWVLWEFPVSFFMDWCCCAFQLQFSKVLWSLLWYKSHLKAIWFKTNTENYLQSVETQ